MPPDETPPPGVYRTQVAEHNRRCPVVLTGNEPACGRCGWVHPWLHRAGGPVFFVRLPRGRYAPDPCPCGHDEPCGQMRPCLPAPGSHLAAAAAEFVGVPYRWGADDEPGDDDGEAREEIEQALACGGNPHEVMAHQARRPGPLSAQPGGAALTVASGPGLHYEAWRHVDLGVWIAGPDEPTEDLSAETMTAGQLRAMLTRRRPGLRGA